MTTVPFVAQIKQQNAVFFF